MKLGMDKTAFLLISLALSASCSTEPPKSKNSVYETPEKRFVTLSNGETYAYIERIPPDFLSGGETILLIHGNNASSLHFLPLFQQIDGARLIAPDMRGFGDSSYNDGFSSLTELAEDIKLFADAIGITKVHVAGWSLGGGVALQLAVLYPELVSSLFLIEGVSHKGMTFFKQGSPYSSKEELAQFPLISLQLAAFERQDAAFFEQSWNISVYTYKKPTLQDNSLYITETLKQRNLTDVFWAMAWFNMSGDHNGYVQGTGTISGIDCPTALTAGANDVVIPASLIRENAAAIPRSRLLEYKNCGHSPMVDCPDRLATDLLAHIRNQ
jgi:pimeloyl-ACP methyl ester carboxylesterase